MSPDLFARYADRIMRVVKELDGVRIGGVNITSILYADDTTLIADLEAKIQNVLNVVVVESEHKGLSINRQKSICMVISKLSVTPSCNITVNGDKLKQVCQFIHLGTLISQDGRYDK